MLVLGLFQRDCCRGVLGMGDGGRGLRQDQNKNKEYLLCSDFDVGYNLGLLDAGPRCDVFLGLPNLEADSECFLVGRAGLVSQTVLVLHLRVSRLNIYTVDNLRFSPC